MFVAFSSNTDPFLLPNFNSSSLWGSLWWIHNITIILKSSKGFIRRCKARLKFLSIRTKFSSKISWYITQFKYPLITSNIYRKAAPIMKFATPYVIVGMVVLGSSVQPYVHFFPVNIWHSYLHNSDIFFFKQKVRQNAPENFKWCNNKRIKY